MISKTFSERTNGFPRESAWYIFLHNSYAIAYAICLIKKAIYFLEDQLYIDSSSKNWILISLPFIWTMFTKKSHFLYNCHSAMLKSCIYKRFRFVNDIIIVREKFKNDVKVGFRKDVFSQNKQLFQFLITMIPFFDNVFY